MVVALYRVMTSQEIAARDTNTFLQRLIGAAALDTAIYEEVEADKNVLFTLLYGAWSAMAVMSNT
jgi:hypothetical protein